MANVQHKNSIYVDSTGSITVKTGVEGRCRISKIILTPTGVSAQLVIKETNNSGTIKADIRTTDVMIENTRVIDYGEEGLLITSTFYISTLTNCIVVLIGDFFAN